MYKDGVVRTTAPNFHPAKAWLPQTRRTYSQPWPCHPAERFPPANWHNNQKIVHPLGSSKDPQTSPLESHVLDFPESPVLSALRSEQAPARDPPEQFCKPTLGYRSTIRTALQKFRLAQFP